MEENNKQIPDTESATVDAEIQDAKSKGRFREKLPAFAKNLLDKISYQFKRVDRKKVKKRIVLCTVSIVIIGAAFAVYEMLTNNYMTPIRTLEKYANSEEYSVEKAALAYGNGLGRRETKRIFKILHNSETYMDAIDEAEDEIVDYYGRKLDNYGEDFYVKYEELDKLELEKSELRDYRSKLQDYLEMYEDLVDYTEDFDSGDWSDLADDLDLTKSDTKQLIAEYQKLIEEMGRLKVSKGYELELSETITGSELEQSEIDDFTVVVLRVNGRWIRYEDFKTAFGALIDYF